MIRTILIIVARLIFAATFAIAVWFKYTGMEATAGYIASVGFPIPMVLAWLAAHQPPWRGRRGRSKPAVPLPFPPVCGRPRAVFFLLPHVGIGHCRSSSYLNGRFQMLYAILCYHDEAVVGSWSKQEDEAVIA